VSLALDDRRLDRVELELRQVPGVVGVGLQSRGASVVVHVLVGDAADAARVRDEVRAAIVAFAAGEVEVEVTAPQPPPMLLAAERDLRRLPGVLHCASERGPHGEIARLDVTVSDRAAAWAAYELVARRVDPAFAAARLHVEVAAAG
jgi:hypothetical protein